MCGDNRSSAREVGLGFVWHIQAGGKTKWVMRKDCAGYYKGASGDIDDVGLRIIVT